VRHALPALAALLALLPAWAQASPLKSLTDRSDILGWEAVGRLNLDGRGYCSASLIAPDTVLTAAHCLFDPEEGDRIDPTTFTFHAGLRDGESIAQSRVTRAVVPDRYDPADQGSAESVRHDVALLELADPIPATTADPFPLARGAAAGHPVTVLSYGAGRSNAMSREIGCTVLAAGKGLIAFDCQAEPGASGAPIFDMTGPSPRILSIVSGGGRYRTRDAVYGMEVASVVGQLRQAMRTGEGVWPDRAPATRRVIGVSERNAGSARFLRP
jgi:protease YdgD